MFSWWVHILYKTQFLCCNLILYVHVCKIFMADVEGFFFTIVSKSPSICWTSVNRLLLNPKTWKLAQLKCAAFREFYCPLHLINEIKIKMLLSKAPPWPVATALINYFCALKIRRRFKTSRVAQNVKNNRWCDEFYCGNLDDKMLHVFEIFISFFGDQRLWNDWLVS